jgi:hypothetical protein
VAYPCTFETVEESREIWFLQDPKYMFLSAREDGVQKLTYLSFLDGTYEVLVMKLRGIAPLTCPQPSPNVGIWGSSGGKGQRLIPAR